MSNGIIIGDLVGGLAMALIAIAAIVVTIMAALWALVDAEGRGMRGWPVALLVLFMHIPGLLLWLLIRPAMQSNRATQRASR
jgi:hypothetical protein